MAGIVCCGTHTVEDLMRGGDRGVAVVGGLVWVVVVQVRVCQVDPYLWGWLQLC